MYYHCMSQYKIGVYHRISVVMFMPHWCYFGKSREKPTIRCKKECYTWKIWKKRTFSLHTTTKSIFPPPPQKQCCVSHIVRLSTTWFGSIFSLINIVMGGRGGHIDIFGLFKKCNISFATDCRNVINYQVQNRGLLPAKMKARLLISHKYWIYINI